MEVFNANAAVVIAALEASVVQCKGMRSNGGLREYFRVVVRRGRNQGPGDSLGSAPGLVRSIVAVVCARSFPALTCTWRASSKSSCTRLMADLGY